MSAVYHKMLHIIHSKNIWEIYLTVKATQIALERLYGLNMTIPKVAPRLRLQL